MRESDPDPAPRSRTPQGTEGRTGARSRAARSRAAARRWRAPGGSAPGVWACLTAACLLQACITPTTERGELDELAVQQEREYQRRLVIRRELDYQRRLRDVSYPLLRAATPLCVNDLGRGVGLQFASVNAYPPEYRRAAAAVLGLDDHVRIIQVAAGSASAGAGILPGDVIVAVNGREVGQGGGATRATRSAFDRAARSGAAIEIDLRRGTSRRTVSIEPEPICYYPVELIDDDVINAYADGERIFVTRGMMRFAEDDHSLALVIAHELAHNAMDHIEAQQKNRMVGRLVDLAAKAYGVDTRGAFTTVAMRSRSESFEAEADYVALYVMALAGRPIEEAADFWRLMAIEHPESIEDGYLATHPSTAERYVAIDAGVEEVLGKKAAGEPLMPNHRRFVSRFLRAPLAFRMHGDLRLDTRSGRPVTLPGGCWRRVGETRHGVAYIPEGGTISIHGERAALILDDAAAKGLWKIRRARFLSLDAPLDMDPVAEPIFECGQAPPVAEPATPQRRVGDGGRLLH